MLYNFRNDYSEGAHNNILEALLKSNLEQENGYGLDSHCKEAERLIKNKINNNDADIHFVSGGTQANLIIISSILRSYESVICASTGHINVHETGAIEATGHKINIMESDDGKISVEGIKKILDEHADEHMVKPRLVFISNSTELGTIYKKEELKEISEFCKANDLYLHLDGARLGSALASRENDLTLEDITNLVDVFYIGGTKNGALLGEAIVINNKELKTNFRYNIKQKGGMLAKGRLLGVQFVELFKEDLFFEVARHANLMAYKISDELEHLGCEFLTKPVSNQVFPILDNELIEKLSEDYGFNIERKINDNKSAIRLVTSWATEEDAVDEFICNFKKLYK
ncbi:threonine aldolase family protein [Romboutsia sp.]|uniref:threonine aldolase family protein n=1 Tax=Romboutsia sp. TaxID=1965302 RepID=UPI003F32423D